MKFAIENSNSYKKAKRKLMIGKKQIMTFWEYNIRTRDRNKVIEIATKFFRSTRE